MRRTAMAAAAAAAAVLAAACGGSGGPDKAGGTEKGPPVVLNMANGNGDTVELEPFARAVRRLSGGSIRIVFHNDWRGGSTAYETGVIRDVAAGKADLAWTGARAFDSVGVSTFDALIAPLLIDSYALEQRVMGDRRLVGPMLGGLDEVGVVGLGVLPGPMRKPLGTAPLVRPDDYRGRTIALNRSEVGASALRALGARPVEIARGGPIDRYDGVEQQIGSINGNLYDKTAPFLTANINLWPRPLVLFASPKAMRRLTAAQRKALTDAARVAGPATLAKTRSDEREAADDICRRGRTFLAAPPEDLAALRQAVQPVYNRLERDPVTKAAIARITALRARVDRAAQAEAPVCRAAAPAATSRPTPIDGVYVMHSTARELRASGAPESDVVPENYGDWRMVLSRGHWSQQQPQGDSAQGTYTVRGDRFTFTVTDASGGVAKNKPGEQFTYRWSRFRDVLTLRPVPGGVSPEVYRVNPWRRIGAAPGQAADAQRTPVDGVWRMTTTAADFEQDPGPANWGTWTYVFDRGRFAVSQHNGQACTWGYGTYTVNGHRMAWTFTDGGGRTPDEAYNKPGEHFVFGWSRFRDRLTLSAVRGAISPDNFFGRPWRLVTATPAKRFLDRRCLPPAAALRGMR